MAYKNTWYGRFEKEEKIVCDSAQRDNVKNYAFWAVCEYSGKKEFYFYSPLFTAESWEEVFEKGENLVKQEWAKISSHEAPKIKSLRSGYMGYYYEGKEHIL